MKQVSRDNEAHGLLPYMKHWSLGSLAHFHHSPVDCTYAQCYVRAWDAYPLNEWWHHTCPLHMMHNVAQNQSHCHHTPCWRWIVLAALRSDSTVTRTVCVHMLTRVYRVVTCEECYQYHPRVCHCNRSSAVTPSNRLDMPIFITGTPFGFLVPGT